MTVELVLLTLTLLTIKHWVCDFVLQTDWMIAEKGHYGKIGGIVHSGIHGVFTLIVFLIVTKSVEWSLIVASIDLISHYHIDWLKSRLSKKYTVTDSAFWNWLGADQMMHGLIYILLVYTLI
jgi:hypothetical protein